MGLLKWLGSIIGAAVVFTVLVAVIVALLSFGAFLGIAITVCIIIGLIAMSLRELFGK